MQVEVSKYTEGVNDKALRPNGLPKSLIKYDGVCKIFIFFFSQLSSHILKISYSVNVSARQKEKALDSMTEVVQTVKHPRSHLSMSQNSTMKNAEERMKDFMPSRQAETQSTPTPDQQTPQWDTKSNSSQQDSEKRSRRSLRLSLIG